MEDIITSFDRAKKLRYERKFTCQGIPKSTIVQVIKNHPAGFREIFQLRHVNNIYLDTPGLQYYKDNVIGISRRKKVRIRWYGDVFGQHERPKLEYKLKFGLLGDKWTFPLKPLTIEDGLSKKSLFNQLDKASLNEVVQEDLKYLEPALLNTYQRSYYRSRDGKFRFTVDEKLTYYYIDNSGNLFKHKVYHDGDVIVELKYDPQHDDQAPEITNGIPFRLSKSSKYVNGIDFLKVRQKF